MKRSMDIRWSEVRAGVLLTAALILLALGIFMVGQKTRLFTPTAIVEVLMPSVQGLKAGAPVWLSGVEIGTVADIAFADPLRSDQVTVTLAIDAAAARRLGPDAQVTIKTRGLLGEKYVDITPGNRYGLAPAEPLQGVPPMGLDEVVQRAYAAMERFDRMAAGFEQSEGSLRKLVADPALYDNLTQLTARLQRLLGAMTEGEGSLARIINDPQLYREMVAFSVRGKEAATQLQQFTASLEAADGTLGRLARDPSLYEESLRTVQRAGTSLTELEALLRGVREGEGTAGKLVSDAELHDRLLRTLENLDALARDMKANPGRYVRFSLF